MGDAAVRMVEGGKRRKGREGGDEWGLWFEWVGG